MTENKKSVLWGAYNLLDTVTLNTDIDSAFAAVLEAQQKILFVLGDIEA